MDQSLADIYLVFKQQHETCRGFIRHVSFDFKEQSAVGLQISEPTHESDAKLIRLETVSCNP